METSDDRTSRALDSALEMTFPASDPIAVYMPRKLVAVRPAADINRKGDPE